MDETLVRKDAGWLLLLAAGVLAFDQIGGVILSLMGIQPATPKGESWLAFSHSWLKQAIALGLVLLVWCAGLVLRKRWETVRLVGDVAFLLALITAGSIAILLYGYTTLLATVPIFHPKTFVASNLRVGILLLGTVVWFVLVGRLFRALRRRDLTEDRPDRQGVRGPA